MSEKKEFEPLDVGATERVDWRTAQGLSKYVHFDENGNAVLGKNLEVDGAIKLSGGFKPIHHYEISGSDGSVNNIDVYFESVSSDDYYYFMGKFNDGFAIGTYILDGAKVSDYTIISISDPYDAAAYMYIKIGSEDGISYPLANGNDTQSKVFTHTLTLTADKPYTLIYQSTNNLKVESVANLRKIMKVTATSDNVILPVCASDLSGTAVLQVTTALCKIGTANVTAVTDKVSDL